jgi:hypothetical protein
MKFTLIVIAVAATLLAGCASEDPNGKVVWTRMMSTPYEKRGEAYTELLHEGLLSPAKYDEMFAQWQAGMPRWEQEQKEKRDRARDLAALTPAQRLNLDMRERELEAQQQRQNADAEARADQDRQQRQANIRAAFAGMATNANAQIQANLASQQALNNAIIANGVRNATAQPRTYDSTITPSYPGGPVTVHTEQTGGN